MRGLYLSSFLMFGSLIILWDMHQFDSVAKAKLQNSDVVLNYEFEIRTGSYNPKPLTQKQYT